jgi:predicted GIY-YIG superfamily endonuclease
VKSTGALGRENVGMSNRNCDENSQRRKPEVSSAMAIIGGLGDPKDNPALSDRYYLWYESNMFYLYVLKKKNSRYLYVGYTNNLRVRLKAHKYDKWKNFSFVYCEVYTNEADARERERMLKKYGAGLGHIRRRLKNTLNNV